jgi:hypothetical protein
MRGNDDQLQSGTFSYVSPEDRIPERTRCAACVN